MTTLLSCDGVTLMMRGGELLDTSCCCSCCGVCDPTGSSSSGSGNGYPSIAQVWTLVSPAERLPAPAYLRGRGGDVDVPMAGSRGALTHLRFDVDQFDGIPEAPAP